MLQRLLLGTVTGRAMLVLFAAGILLRMITVVSYKKMKRAAEHAGKTKKQWVQILKKRFENYERFGRVRDVSSFVDHYFSRKGILGVPLAFWDRSVLFLSLAILMTGLGSSFWGYLNGGEWDFIFLPLYAGAMLALGLFMIHNLGTEKEAKEQIKAALTDYLANSASQRTKECQEKRERDAVPVREEVEALSEAAVTEEEKQVLMEVLEDYFW